MLNDLFCSTRILTKSHYTWRLIFTGLSLGMYESLGPIWPSKGNENGNGNGSFFMAEILCSWTDFRKILVNFFSHAHNK